MISDTSKRFYGDDQSVSIVALVKAPSESLSQAYSSNLHTGTEVDWQGHVRMTQDWARSDNELAYNFAKAVDQRARQLGVSAPMENLGALNQLRNTLAQYDSLDELARDKGVDSPEYKAEEAIHKAMADDSSSNSEGKINNPLLGGFGIIRNGQNVVLENLPLEILQNLKVAKQAPSWFTAAPAAPGSTAVVVPQTIWEAAMKRNVPLVVLDP
jgi:hypothetical protein